LGLLGFALVTRGSPRLRDNPGLCHAIPVGIEGGLDDVAFAALDDGIARVILPVLSSLTGLEWQTKLWPTDESGGLFPVVPTGLEARGGNSRDLLSAAGGKIRIVCCWRQVRRQRDWPALKRD